MRTRTWSGALPLLALLLPEALAADAPGPENTPIPRPVPGLTTADLYPQGCVDCHVVYAELGRDKRLSVILQGRHPAAAAEFVDVPADCLDCHDRGPDPAPSLARIVHLAHLTGADNVFLSVFQGECTHCHKLDTRTGAWRLPSAPEK